MKYRRQLLLATRLLARMGTTAFLRASVDGAPLASGDIPPPRNPTIDPATDLPVSATDSEFATYDHEIRLVEVEATLDDAAATRRTQIALVFQPKWDTCPEPADGHQLVYDGYLWTLGEVRKVAPAGGPPIVYRANAHR